MPSQARSGLRDAISRRLNLIFPVLLVSAVLVLVVPLPPLLMDFLLAANITLSVVILLTTIHVANPLEFSVFPALLLGTTLARLVLNVASTRLILTGAAQQGTHAAGRVIEAFGDFVAAGSPAVGLIIFCILVVIQFLVVTKGATRISEVAARFALDGMPGKQMAVDADLAAGLITREESRLRRQQIALQADFYGAMDGASKFVRGDAVAGLVITVVNILGGLAVGMFNEGLSFQECLPVFTILTIGDGLVAQIPAFLISIAAALIVTRTSQDSDLSRDAVGQMFRHPTALYIAAGFLCILAFTGLPFIPLMALGLGCASVAWLLQHPQPSADPVAETPKLPVPAAPAPQPQDQLRIEPLELELGIGLIRLAEAQAGGNLLECITRVRHRVAQELGFILPKVRVRDNLRLDPRQYQIKLRDIPVAWGTAYADALLAVDTGRTSGTISGIEATAPSLRRGARWIEPAQRDEARKLGYELWEPPAVLADHLLEVARTHAESLLTRQQVHALLDDLKLRSPELVRELIPTVLTTAHVHQVLSHLLQERVPIRDLETILETLGEHAEQIRDPRQLTEIVRGALARAICQRFVDGNRRLHVLCVSPALDALIDEHLSASDGGGQVHLPREVSSALTEELHDRLKRLTNAGHPPVLLCRPGIRPALSGLAMSVAPDVAVLSTREITRDTAVVSHGELNLEHSLAATTAGYDPAR